MTSRNLSAFLGCSRTWIQAGRHTAKCSQLVENSKCKWRVLFLMAATQNASRTRTGSQTPPRSAAEGQLTQTTSMQRAVLCTKVQTLFAFVRSQRKMFNRKQQLGALCRAPPHIEAPRGMSRERELIVLTTSLRFHPGPWQNLHPC